jgi:hypothetical protein
MKKALLLSVLFLAGFVVSSGFAQTAPTTAMDFTALDCDGAQHQLFTELDEGKVILLEFVMNCQSCENARTILETVEAEFAESHPGRFSIYTMSYTNSTTCEKMKAWPVVKNHQPSTSFVGVSDQLEYYGGFGMPTIVVVGGKDHKILYSSIGFPHQDTSIVKEVQKIIDAVAGVLTQAAVEVASNEPFALYPNPAHDKLMIALPSQLSMGPSTSMYTADVRILNLLGSEVMHQTVEAVDDVELDISSLSAGMYSLVFTGFTGEVKQGMFIKQ